MSLACRWVTDESMFPLIPCGHWIPVPFQKLEGDRAQHRLQLPGLLLVLHLMTSPLVQHL